MMSQQTERVDQIKSYFINRFLNSLSKRLDANDRPFILAKGYFIVFLYWFLIIKYVIMLFVKFDYETRLILNDPSIWIGGIHQYNTIAVIFGCIWGIRLHKMLYLTTSTKLLDWTQLIYKITGSVGPQNLRFNSMDASILNNLNSQSKLLYKLSDLISLSSGRTSFNYILQRVLLIASL